MSVIYESLKKLSPSGSRGAAARGKVKKGPGGIVLKQSNSAAKSVLGLVILVVGLAASIQTHVASAELSDKRRVTFAGARPAIARVRSPEGDEEVLALVNVTAEAFRLEVSPQITARMEGEWIDLITRKTWGASDGAFCMDLEPYDVLWLTPSGPKGTGR